MTERKTRVLFVGGLSYSTSEDRVRDLFSECGTVETVSIQTDQNGKSKGIAYVTMQTPEAAENALKKHESTLDGRIIKVELYKQQRRDKRRRFRDYSDDSDYSDDRKRKHRHKKHHKKHHRKHKSKSKKDSDDNDEEKEAETENDGNKDASNDRPEQSESSKSKDKKEKKSKKNILEKHLIMMKQS